MFCMNCGKEIPNEARFCMHCGTGLGAPSNQAAQTANPPPHPSTAHANKRLSKRHTFDWRAECPACSQIHNSENANCPNDGSPLVVAFDEFDRLLPVHSAGLRCLRDCGYRSHAMTCNHDGVLITGRNILFRFRKFNVIAHNLVYGVMALLGLAALLPLIPIAALLRQDPMNGVVAIVWVLVILVVARFFLDRVFQHWYPFKRTFTFNDVEKAERLNGRLKSREESEATAGARRGL